jgi:hypothetical protein
VLRWGQTEWVSGRFPTRKPKFHNVTENTGYSWLSGLERVGGSQFLLREISTSSPKSVASPRLL